MRVDVAITVRRDDGTVLSRAETIEQRPARYFRDGSTRRETKAELRARLESVVTAALNATVGRG